MNHLTQSSVTFTVVQIRHSLKCMFVILKKATVTSSDKTHEMIASLHGFPELLLQGKGGNVFMDYDYNSSTHDISNIHFEPISKLK